MEPDRTIVLEPRERIAVFLDLENLLFERELSLVTRAVRALVDRGDLVTAVACCAPGLARTTAFRLRDLGVRVFVHGGGSDAADRELLARIRSELPSRVDTVVIGSGDHIFAEAAAELRARGKTVEVLAVAGRLSAALYRAATACTVLA